MKPQFAFVIAILVASPLVCQQATVKVGTANVYAQQRRSEDGIVSSLKRGTAVMVEFANRSSEGEWCKVHESAGKAKGYMRCNELERGQIEAPATRLPDPPAVSGEGQTPDPSPAVPDSSEARETRTS